MSSTRSFNAELSVTAPFPSSAAAAAPDAAAWPPSGDCSVAAGCSGCISGSLAVCFCLAAAAAEAEAVGSAGTGAAAAAGGAAFTAWSGMAPFVGASSIDTTTWGPSFCDHAVSEEDILQGQHSILGEGWLFGVLQAASATATGVTPDYHYVCVLQAPPGYGLHHCCHGGISFGPGQPYLTSGRWPGLRT